MNTKILIALITITPISLAHTDDGIPMMASRANCSAISPVGVGYHNESVSWTLGQPKSMLVETVQAGNGVTRSKKSPEEMEEFPNEDMEYGLRAYAGYVDSLFQPKKNWTVVGKHTYEFAVGDIGYRETIAYDCNLSQGWPWS